MNSFLKNIFNNYSNFQNQMKHFPYKTRNLSHDSKNKHFMILNYSTVYKIVKKVISMSVFLINHNLSLPLLELL